MSPDCLDHLFEWSSSVVNEFSFKITQMTWPLKIHGQKKTKCQQVGSFIRSKHILEN